MRPGIVSEIENIIWEELFEIAQGSQSIYNAAANISDRLPKEYDHFDEDTRLWFKLGNVIIII
jgi:hypothetical protein